MELRMPSAQSSKLTVLLDGKKETISMGEIPIKYSKLIKLEKDYTEMKFISDAQPIANGDPRNIVFGIFNFKIVELI
jgi:hypothetical protein